MPAASARFALAALRPASEVRTRTPLSANRRPMPAPILPGATIATEIDMRFSKLALLAADAVYNADWTG
jgi:hypothetical protein